MMIGVSNGVAFDWEVVIPPKRTAMCLFVEGDGGDAVEFVEANNAEVREGEHV